jgi:hypothetical protein
MLEKQTNEGNNVIAVETKTLRLQNELREK